MKIRIKKRDHACLWFKHLPTDLVAAFEQLESGDQFLLLVNEGATFWTRMKSQPDGRPTNGVKILSGQAVWSPLPLGQDVNVEWFGSDDAANHRSELTTSEVDTASLLPQRESSVSPLFDQYLFADYSGAQSPSIQRRAIKAVHARRGDKYRTLGSMTRTGLVTRTMKALQDADSSNERLCAGFDHQYSVPAAFTLEMGLENVAWRGLLSRLVRGQYGQNAPPLAGPVEFAQPLNQWLVNRGSEPYFWSATKSDRYGIPDHQPRGRPNTSLYRLTERAQPIGGSGNPKPFCRLGDNGTVGGQTLFGLRHLHDLLEACAADRIPLKVWPFDGLDIRDYDGFHVLLEPYPAIGLVSGIPKSDLNDAIASLLLVKSRDEAGELMKLLNLEALSDEEKQIVRLEGWIVGHLPMIVR